MADKPIPFSGPSVFAWRAGRKSMTRRIIDPQPFADGYHVGKVFCDFVPSRSHFEPACFRFSVGAIGGGAVRTEIYEPRYAVGDRLWVRESYYQFGHWGLIPGAKTKGGKPKWGFVADDPEIRFEMGSYLKAMNRADPHRPAWHKRLGRFMPKVASRMTLIVEAVKVERLQDISVEDAIAEGVEHPGNINPFIDGDGMTVEVFKQIWESINGPGSWDANPWVVAVGFSVVNANIDQVPA